MSKQQRPAQPRAITANGSIILFAVLVLVVAAVLASGYLFSNENNPEEKPVMTVYKSPTCGCCSKWVEHLEENGIEVIVEERMNMQPVKQQFGVSSQHQSCHTALIDGYVIEGHVPAVDIYRLIQEQPDLKGLAVPGMPMGSPGMEGQRSEHYSVLGVHKDGRSSLFSSY